MKYLQNLYCGYLIIMILKSKKFWKAMDKEAVHVVLWSGHELTEGPEGVLLRVEVHQEEGGYLGHALAVAHLRVEHTVGRQHVEQGLLSGVVPLTEHLMITIRPDQITDHYTLRDSRHPLGCPSPRIS